MDEELPIEQEHGGVCLILEAAQILDGGDGGSSQAQTDGGADESGS